MNYTRVMKRYQTYIDEKQYSEAIAWLVQANLPSSRSHWEQLSTFVQNEPELFWFCRVHCGSVAPNHQPPPLSYLDICNTLSKGPSILEQYTQVSQQERELWGITQPPVSTEECAWCTPLYLFEDQIELLLSHLKKETEHSVEAVVMEQVLTHLHKKEYFDFFCGLYLWKKTWHTLKPQFLTSLGTWILKFWDNEHFPISSKTLFSSMLSVEEKIQLSDALQVHIYDLEEHAFSTEVEPHIVEKNRGNNYDSDQQRLYGILPIIEDLGTDATDKSVEFLCAHISEHPDDLWAKATLLFVASRAQTISADRYTEVINTRKQLIKRFPQDSLLRCFDEDNRSSEDFHSILPSKKGFQALSYLQPAQLHWLQLLTFYTGSNAPNPIIKDFCISQKIRQHNKNKTEPSMIHIIIPTIAIFILSIWMLGSILGKLM